MAAELSLSTSLDIGYFPVQQNDRSPDNGYFHDNRMIAKYLS
jgi:hypothetical protein